MIFAFYLLSMLATLPQEADMILVNGRVYTVDSAFHITQSVVIDNGVILATGNTRDILSQYTSAQIIDLRGKTVLPGFNDGHCHFLSYGVFSHYAQLYGLSSWDAVLDQVRHFNTEATDGWVLGRGWDQNLWADKSFPDCAELDKLFPNNPVYLERVDGHAAVVNTKTLELAGINHETKVSGGIVATKGNKCTGLLIDNAKELVDDILPDRAPDFLAASLNKAQTDCFSYGLTSVQDAGLKKYQMDAVLKQKEEGLLPIRMNVMLTPEPENLRHFLPNGPIITDDLVIRSVKYYADGALGSRGAALIEPYADDTTNYGLLILSDDSLKTAAKQCLAAGFQMCVHAIGDAANRQVLQVYADVLGGPNDLRWRIEHCQIIHPDDMHYFGDYDIIPSVQATHATSDMLWADERLGEERLKSAYTYKDLMQENGRLVNGTDFPVEQINPLLTFYTAVVRKNAWGEPNSGFQMENALDRSQALRSITIWPAYASFEEKIKGSIEPGKLADLVILDKDIMSIPYPEITNARVVATILSGQVVYQSEDWQIKD
jgi:predicted amidohydrolase YtcJ